MTKIQNDKKFDLEERTAIFGENIIELAKVLPHNNINKVLVSQIVRSATSVGANYMEANGAESKKDFIHKIHLCKKESKETMHWLRMVAQANPGQQAKSRKYWQEAKELTLIFSKISQAK